ncbi:hypothetical protein J1614_006345 [Plenodomus biglobosus]|nr:hypothetical protein J1614_006345 [Plenodomus biglobosus]
MHASIDVQYLLTYVCTIFTHSIYYCAHAFVSHCHPRNTVTCIQINCAPFVAGVMSTKAVKCDSKSIDTASSRNRANSPRAPDAGA